jgi:hypothetical protein
VLPRRFALVRHVDYTGVSGVGVVAYGVAFADGQVVLRWCSTHPATSLWTSLDDLLAVHGHGEATSIEWIDAPHGNVEDVVPPKRTGRRAKRRADGADETPAGASDTVQREPEPSEPEPVAGAAGPGPPKPPAEPLAPLPRRPVRLVTHGDHDAINGRLGTDTAPLLFEPFRRDRPPPESSRPPPLSPAPSESPTRSPESAIPEPTPGGGPDRRPGRHRRPDQTDGTR